MAWKQAGSRPPKPTGVLREHPIKYAGVTVSEKVELVRKELTKERATALVVTSLDEIAWLLNFRGN